MSSAPDKIGKRLQFDLHKYRYDKEKLTIYTSFYYIKIKLSNLLLVILYHFVEGKSWEETRGECQFKVGDVEASSQHTTLDKAKVACLTNAKCIGVYEYCDNIPTNYRFRTCETSIERSWCGARFYKIPSKISFQI